MNTKDSINKSEFLVIGAGLGRTGTMSLKIALEMILPGKCHHMITAVFHQEEWRDILTGKMSDDDFKEFFLSNNYVAGVDVPFCWEYERAMAVFPNAKIILTVREPQGWVKSIKSTVSRVFAFESPAILFLSSGLFSTYLSLHNVVGFPKVLLDAFYNNNQRKMLTKAVSENRGVEYFNNWIDGVEKKVPAKKLLKFNVKEGWEPLCKFLNVPVPDAPFPNVNSSAFFIEELNRRNRRSWLLLYEFISLPLLIGGLYILTTK